MTLIRKRMTLKYAQRLANQLGYTIKRTGWDTELIVAPTGLKKADAERVGYYTSDVDDALSTARSMAVKVLVDNHMGVGR